MSIRQVTVPKDAQSPATGKMMSVFVSTGMQVRVGTLLGTALFGNQIITLSSPTLGQIHTVFVKSEDTIEQEQPLFEIQELGGERNEEKTSKVLGAKENLEQKTVQTMHGAEKHTQTKEPGLLPISEQKAKIQALSEPIPKSTSKVSSSLSGSSDLPKATAASIASSAFPATTLKFHEGATASSSASIHASLFPVGSNPSSSINTSLAKATSSVPILPLAKWESPTFQKELKGILSEVLSKENIRNTLGSVEAARVEAFLAKTYPQTPREEMPAKMIQSFSNQLYQQKNPQQSLDQSAQRWYRIIESFPADKNAPHQLPGKSTPPPRDGDQNPRDNAGKQRRNHGGSEKKDRKSDENTGQPHHPQNKNGHAPQPPVTAWPIPSPYRADQRGYGNKSSPIFPMIFPIIAQIAEMILSEDSFGYTSRHASSTKSVEAVAFLVYPVQLSYESRHASYQQDQQQNSREEKTATPSQQSDPPVLYERGGVKIEDISNDQSSNQEPSSRPRV